MPKSELQYALYEIPTAAKPNDQGILPSALITASLPLPQWLLGNIVITGSGFFVVYYSVYFSDPQVSSALFQNEFEIPATRLRGSQNHGYVILSTSGNIQTKLSLRSTDAAVLHGKILISELSFHDEKSVVE